MQTDRIFTGDAWLDKFRSAFRLQTGKVKNLTSFQNCCHGIFDWPLPKNKKPAWMPINTASMRVPLRPLMAEDEISAWSYLNVYARQMLAGPDYLDSMKILFHIRFHQLLFAEGSLYTTLHNHVQAYFLFSYSAKTDELIAQKLWTILIRQHTRLRLPNKCKRQ